MTDDRFKRYQDAGTDFLETARARAEDFLRELAKATESTQKQAQGQVDDLVAAGRQGTNQMIDLVRREVESQLSQLGVVTKAEFEAWKRRLGGTPAKKAAATKTPAQKASAATAAAPAQKSAATKAAPVKKSSATKGAAAKSTAKKSPAKKSPAKKSPAKKSPAKKTTAKKASSAVKKAPGSTS